MKKILSAGEAQEALELLTESEKAEVERDKIRFGEFYIGSEDNTFFRLNPINIITVNGKPEVIDPISLTEI